MEAMDKEVRKVMLVEIVTITKVPISPTLPTTHPNRRYMITPRMVRTEGVNTPPKVPSPSGRPGATFLLFRLEDVVVSINTGARWYKCAVYRPARYYFIRYSANGLVYFVEKSIVDSPTVDGPQTEAHDTLSATLTGCELSTGCRAL